MSAELVSVGAEIERVLITGDLAKLSPDQRVNYYQAVCQSVGLNPLTKPFDYLQLNGKTVLYATRACTDQLRKLNGVSIRIVHRETVDGVYSVTASATDKSDRVDESTGAVSTAGLKGNDLANAIMKAETKAKRRVTLSICGLGVLDESEVETIPVASRAVPAVEPAPAKPVVAALEAGADPNTQSAAYVATTNSLDAVANKADLDRVIADVKDHSDTYSAGELAQLRSRCRGLLNKFAKAAAVESAKPAPAPEPVAEVVDDIAA